MRRLSIGASILGALGIVSLIATSAAAGSNTTTLQNGAELTATISTPSTGDTFLIPPPGTDIDVPIEGNASIGEGAPNVHWTYVVDVSGSAGAGCGLSGQTILDCEKTAVTNLNADIAAGGSGLDVGLSVYGSSGATADMNGAGGQQNLTTPGSPDVGTVINSVGIGGLGQFTAMNVGSGATNFTAGLNAALVSVSESAAVSKNVVFLSDGESNQGGGGFDAAVAAHAAAGSTIYSFAVGSGSSCSSGNAGTLDAMSAATGGFCTFVGNPANLPDIIEDITATAMTALALTVDGAVTAFDTNSNPPAFDGPDDTDVTATAAAQAPGAHQACLTATGVGPKGDNSSEDSASVCETYYVYAFGLTPLTATNELSTDQAHTVTADLSGEAGFLAGFKVDFEITAGPNTGQTGSGDTDANGDLDFDYTNPNIDPSGLGTDTIEATITVGDETATIAVTKDWVDTTPPTATCVETVNPSGRKIPQAPGKGGQAQNQDGFYVLDGADDVWPSDSLDLFVTDSGSGTVFGPYAIGTTIKYTEDPDAAPEAKTMGGPNSATDWHIIGNGDGVLTVVDGSGNVSDGMSCLVPPAPK